MNDETRRRDAILLRHIRESIDWIERFTRDDPRASVDDMIAAEGS